MWENQEKFLFVKMSSRGFLLRMPDDDLYDPELRPISPNIIISRSEYFQEGEKISVIELLKDMTTGDCFMFVKIIWE